MIENMKKMLFSIAMLVSLQAMAQQENLNNSVDPIDTLPPIDGYVMKSDVENRKVVPYANIRQTDIAFSKRVWREIDLREKFNQAFASPKSSLISILLEAIQEGKLRAYDPTPTKNDPNGDSFKTLLAPDQVMARFGGDSILVEEFNENNEVVGSSYQQRDFDPTQVVKFRIKEDWIFDKQRSVFEARIIGIAPLITPQIPGMSDFQAPNADENAAASPADPFDPFAVQAAETEGAESTAENANVPIAAIPAQPFAPQIDATPAFWIYFPEARHVLVNKEVMNRNSDATGLSYDDVFIKRMFSSYIVKQSNPEDLRIKDYISDDLERLFESERIKKSLMDYEQDLWSY
ncbi:gliding motility protein GldN [Sphingobacterium sp. HJSM2_6]|uniref:type IX secretion system ring protein PorN/GldN n=1 Tax=Sphingobacterium sp. HJSM2_6 TaxID=3366264 RepID=UPI003BD52682